MVEKVRYMLGEWELEWESSDVSQALFYCNSHLDVDDIEDFYEVVVSTV